DVQRFTHRRAESAGVGKGCGKESHRRKVPVMRWTTLAVVVLTGCATAHVPSQPAAVNEKTVAQSPTVVVIADVGERADAARLQALVGEAVRNVRAPLKVTIHYYGAANAKSLLPVQIGKGIPRRLLFGEFTITDSAGRTLDADSI